MKGDRDSAPSLTPLCPLRRLCSFPTNRPSTTRARATQRGTQSPYLGPSSTPYPLRRTARPTGRLLHATTGKVAGARAIASSASAGATLSLPYCHPYAVPTCFAVSARVWAPVASKVGNELGNCWLRPCPPPWLAVSSKLDVPRESQTLKNHEAKTLSTHAVIRSRIAPRAAWLRVRRESLWFAAWCAARCRLESHPYRF